MNIEILEVLLQNSKNTDKAIREYLDESVDKKLTKYELFDCKINELYLSTRIIVISKSTLDILYEGSVMGIYDDIIRLKVKSKYCINIHKDEGYIFMKTKKSKVKQEYYKQLLDSLS